VSLFAGPAPLLTLAPMQDVTNGAFWTLVHRYGGADIYWTEYFRVHETSSLEKWIVNDITTNTTGRPVVAQMIGNDIPALVRTAKLLQQLPVAAIDLNLGCPAPIVYRKCAGGGLLRGPERVDRILGELRSAITTRFTVKTRIGFATADEFDRLLPIFARHSLDALTVHGRTVAQGYRLPVDYGRIRQAVETMACPVIANGHVYSATQAMDVLRETRAAGLMIGRGAIRSPWLFTQIRHRPHRSRRARLRARVVGFAGQLRQARDHALRANEEVPELSWRGCNREFLARHPPHQDGSGFSPHLRGAFRSRPPHDHGAGAGRGLRTQASCYLGSNAHSPRDSSKRLENDRSNS
jgi:tRNA-dihydrouridine synthase